MRQPHATIMERLIHYVWKHRILPMNHLLTTDGQPLEVVDSGLHNSNAGPDFFNAKVRIGDTMWAGNVEVHLRSSDWHRHGHDSDPAYNNVVLHVVCEADCEVVTQNLRHPAQLQLAIPEILRQDYERLFSVDRYPRCHSIIPKLDTFLIHSWMDTLLQERICQRSQRVMEHLQATDGDWEKALFMTLARNFGFGLNGDAFQVWAQLLPLQRIGKHRDDLLQIEAIFLGLAGLLERGKEQADEYCELLRREFAYQQRLFQLPEPMPAHQWKYLRLRPQNFPHIRLCQLAWMYSQRKLTLSALMDAVQDEKPVQALMQVLCGETSEYWTRHIVFGKEIQKQRKLSLSKTTRNLLIINTVVPVLYAHATAHNNATLAERLFEILRQLPAEDNHILRLWQECGISVDSAADSQALIHLKNEYCDRHDCLRCRFGYEYMTKK